MEILIIGSVCALGYHMNKNGKQGRPSKPVIISPNRQPSGSVIYDSDRVNEVDNYVRNLAAGKHADRVRQMFPNEWNKPINIVPNDLQSDRPTPITTLNSDGTAANRFHENVRIATSRNTNTAAYNPETGNPLETKMQDVETSPMFRAAGFQQQPTSEFGKQISLLTGLPIDMTHANMNPMFGKMVKQPAVGNDNTQVLLERYTGVPSSDDQGTFRRRREVINPLPSNPENPQRANILQLSDLYQRSADSVKPSHEFKTPIKSFRDLPMKTKTRVLPQTIDDVRGPLRKQITYSGVMIPGQKGSTRGMLPNMRGNRWDLSRVTNEDELVPNKSTQRGSTVKPMPHVRDTIATTVTKSDYMAPPTYWRKLINSSSDQYQAQLENRVTRRIEPFAAGFGTAKGINKSSTSGVIMMRDPEKGFVNDRKGQPYQNIGTKLRGHVHEPDATLRDTVAENRVGSINPQGRKNNTAWKKSNIRLDPTSKSMNVHNPYSGLPHKNLGMGGHKHKIEPWITTKETTEFSKHGNPKGVTSAHMSYDAVFEDDINKEIDLDHYGVAKGPTTASAPDGGKRTTMDMEKVLVTDYVTNPKGTSQGRDRKKFADSVDLDYNRVEFGGYYAGGKMGHGEDAKRKGKVRIKDHLVAEGRFNVPLKRDNPNDSWEMEANLRPEKQTIQRKVKQRVQPTAVVTDRTPILTRVKNSEVDNPRLDVGTKIKLTSDYYPWIKNRDAEERSESGNSANV
jgi:hypothetical protein